MRVIEVSKEHHYNVRAGETGDPRENPPTSGIVRHDSHMRKSGLDYSPAHLGEAGSILGGVAHELFHVGIVPDDAAGRWVFSGICRFPRPCIPYPLRVTIIASQDHDARLYSLMHKHVDVNCALAVCCHTGRRRLDQRSPGDDENGVDQWLKLYKHTCFDFQLVPTGGMDPPRPRSRSEGAIRATLTRTPSASSLLRARQWDEAARPRSRSEGAIRATLTRTPSASSLLRASKVPQLDDAMEMSTSLDNSTLHMVCAIPQMLGMYTSRDDKIDSKCVYTEVTFAIGSEFIRHALDDSAPIADSQRNKTGAAANEQTSVVRL
ncbi:hypothetical protein PR048_000364 [Dryococelus australis]|uniref:Uncharacterized protein n=1 Tax=Dryococelus australis TaxID=614101 RepID=A0ABQ9IEF0_9NEOP|nr:hypothetical protein PR048_000364 [Dryococelus australis]